MAAITFSYQHYIGAHGKSPSGFGSWGFSTNPDPNQDKRGTDIIWVRDLFVEAKRKAKTAAQKRYRGPVILYVLP